MTEEGWYFRTRTVFMNSGGSLMERPTVLVRDQGTTSKDSLPDSPYLEEPRLIESPPDHLRRNDGDESASVDSVDAAWTYFKLVAAEAFSPSHRPEAPMDVVKPHRRDFGE